jgi:DNA-binding CsgD family transcriptional regulator
MPSAPRLSAHEVAEAAARDELGDLARWHAPELPPPLLDPSPCDECGIRTRCANEGLACEAFAVFVQVGTKRRWGTAPRQPSFLFYDRLFTEPFKKDHELSGMSPLERRAAVKKLAGRGHSRSVIAELLGVVKSTVLNDLAGTQWQAKPRIFKTPRDSKWLTERRTKAKELAAQGHSTREIADALGVNTVTVSRDLRHAGAIAPPDDRRLWRYRGSKGRFRRTTISEQRVSAVRELVANGHTLPEIAGMFGVHTNTVSMDLKRLGGRRNIRQQVAKDSDMRPPGPIAVRAPCGDRHPPMARVAGPRLHRP